MSKAKDKNIQQFILMDTTTPFKPNVLTTRSVPDAQTVNPFTCLLIARLFLPPLF